MVKGELLIVDFPESDRFIKWSSSNIIVG